MADYRAPLSLCFALACVTACSSSTTHPPPAGSGTATSGGLGAGGTSDAGTDTDAEAGVSDAGPDLCKGAQAQFGQIVQAQGLAGGAPSGLGGPILAGTYLLQELDVYSGTAPVDAGDMPDASIVDGASRQTLTVTADTMVFLGARGATSTSVPADSFSGFTYRVSGTQVVLTSVCPTAGVMQSLPYSAVGGALAIFVDGTHRENYVKQ